jgi:hypothetical protein
VQSGRASTPALAPARVTDATVLATLAGLALLAVDASADHRGIFVASAAVFAAAFLAATAAARRLPSPPGRALLRGVAVAAALLFTYAAVPEVQLVLRGRFLDAALVAFQQHLLGGQPVLWLERIVRPWLTEWMMFGYVAYLALFPLVGAAAWRKGGAELLERCFLALALANAVCAVGFVVFPVAGPHFFLAERFPAPLRGGVFTTIGELIRHRAQYPGASLPSPHCAFATVLWLTAWRSRRRLAVAIGPVVLTLYAATVYGRYHYAADSITGVFTGLLAFAAASWIARRRPGAGTAPAATRRGGEGSPAEGGAGTSSGRRSA